MPGRNKGACKALSPGSSRVRGQGGSRTVLAQPSHQGTRESWGPEGPAGGVSTHWCQRRHQAGIRKCMFQALPFSSPVLTPKSAGFPMGLKELLMGREGQTGGGQAWEAGAQPGPHPTPFERSLCASPALPPLAICPGSPSCWVCSRDAPSAVSQRRGSLGRLEDGIRGAECCSSGGGGGSGIWVCGATFLLFPYLHPQHPHCPLHALPQSPAMERSPSASLKGAPFPPPARSSCRG